MANKKTIKYKPKYKTESLTSFETRLAKLLQGIKNDPKYRKFGDNLVIPPSVILSGMLEAYTSHWPRDLYKSKDGEQKLQCIYNFLADQEMLMSNLLMTDNKHQYGIMKLLDTWNAKRYADQEYALDENETIKDTINIQLNSTGVFKNGNKD